MSSPETPTVFLIAGLTLSGKSTALKTFEHYKNWHALDDVPVALLPAVLEAALNNKGMAAIAVNFKEASLPEWETTMDLLRKTYPHLKLLWLEAATDITVSRYVATNGIPRDSKSPNITAQVALERDQLLPFKALKDYSVETGPMAPAELQVKVAKLVHEPAPVELPFTVNIVSFAYKRGIPNEAEIVLDARFVKNPFYDPALRPLSGLDQPVQDFVLRLPETQSVLSKWLPLVAELIPQYEAQGKHRLTVAFGCTGGQHRSVTLAETLAKHLTKVLPKVQVNLWHREACHWPETATTSTEALCSSGVPA